MSKRKAPTEPAEKSSRSSRSAGQKAGAQSGAGDNRNPPEQVPVFGGRRKENDYEKAICQLLLGCGTVESKAFDMMLERIKGDFVGQPGVTIPLETLFSKINESLRKFSMEIRSVRSKTEEGDWIAHYGLVNTEEDFVSKDHGMKGIHEENELRFFSSKLLPKIVASKYLTTGEVNELLTKGPGSLSKSKVHDLLIRLRSEMWLSSSDRGFWELGPRSYLELRSHIENIMKQGIDDVNLSEEEQNKLLAEEKESLPQVLYY